MITNNDLDIMYDYYLKLSNDPEVDKKRYYVTSNNMKKDELGNIMNLENQFYRFMVDYFGFNGFPKVISDEKYNNFNSPELYHGFVKMSHPSSYLSHWNYHYGQGYISGFFSTDSFKNARKYTVADELSFGYRSKKKVMKLKLNPGKMIKIDDLEEIASIVNKKRDLEDSIVLKKYPEFIEELEKLRIYVKIKSQQEKSIKNTKGFLDLFTFSSILAMYLGIDTVLYKGVYGFDYYIENDRSRVILSQSEAKRFMENGKNLKDCPVNLICDTEFDIISGAEK